MIFDYNKLKIHREFAFQNIEQSSFLIEHAEDIIKDNIDQLSWDFSAQNKVLEILPRRRDLSSFLLSKGASLTTHHLPPEQSDDTLPFQDQSMDLIISTFNLHFVNDVRTLLKSIHNILKPQGVFIANFAVDNSLSNLKKLIIEHEAKAGIGHCAHTIPFIASEKIYLLLQEADFKFIIVNRENIILEYNSHIDLMKDLKNMGENNAMVNAANSLPKSILQEPEPIKDEIILATIIVKKD